MIDMRQGGDQRAQRPLRQNASLARQRQKKARRKGKKRKRKGKKRKRKRKEKKEKITTEHNIDNKRQITNQR